MFINNTIPARSEVFRKIILQNVKLAYIVFVYRFSLVQMSSVLRRDFMGANYTHEMLFKNTVHL